MNINGLKARSALLPICGSPVIRAPTPIIQENNHEHGCCLGCKTFLLDNSKRRPNIRDAFELAEVREGPY